MKITTLINKLVKLRDKEGNIDIFFDGHDVKKVNLEKFDTKEDAENYWGYPMPKKWIDLSEW